MTRPFFLITIMVGLLAGLTAVGCGNADVLNPAFSNTFFGGVVPVTPGPGADFVLVRGLNETGDFAEFIVTIEREVIERDDDGIAQVDDIGNVVTRPVRNTVSILVSPTAPANDQGVLFPCSESPLNLVGLGENLLADDTQLFSGGVGAGGAIGIGITDPTLNPLSREAGNFACGDTIVFRAINSTAVAGGIKIDAFLLSGFEQPDQFVGPNTFLNFQSFLQSQVREDE